MLCVFVPLRVGEILERMRIVVNHFCLGAATPVLNELLRRVTDRAATRGVGNLAEERDRGEGETAIQPTKNLTFQKHRFVWRGGDFLVFTTSSFHGDARGIGP